MRRKSRWWVSLQAGVICLSLALTGCENGNLFGGINNRGDSGDVASLNADAAQALRERNYVEALNLYQRVLAQNPRNSEALYGAAAAGMGTSGINLGILLANIQNQTSAANINSIGDYIAASRISISADEATDPSSVLFGIAIVNLDLVLDNVICWLALIVGQAADGTIDPRDPRNVYILLDLANLCLIRPVLRFLRKGFGDLRDVNGDFEFVIDPFLANNVCDGTNLVGGFTTGAEQQAFLVGLALDLAKAYSLFKRAVDLLGLTSNSVVSKLLSDVETAVTTLLADENPGTVDLNLTGQVLPEECLKLFHDNGINAATFTSNLDVFNSPPSSCPELVLQ